MGGDFDNYSDSISMGSFGSSNISSIYLDDSVSSDPRDSKKEVNKIKIEKYDTKEEIL